jgi:hypothetical protein
VWWYRTWTTQECVLPEQVMFTCGHKVFDTRTLTLASNHWYSHSTSCCYIALLGLPSPDILDNFLDTLQSLERLRSISRDTRTDTQLLYFLSEIRPDLLAIQEIRSIPCWVLKTILIGMHLSFLTMMST